MDVEDAIRTRRTHKAYGSEPVDRETLERALELAPLGAQPPPDEPVALPRARARRRSRALKDAAGPEAAGKLDRAPTLVAVSVAQSGDDPVGDEEDLLRRRRAPPTSCCSARTRAGSPATGARPRSCARRPGAPRWASPTASTRSACCTSARARQDQPVPERAPVADVVSWLD